MNLSTDPWIPVILADGRSNTMSLCEIFQKGNNVRDLAVRPHERIAIMRLLICIVQTALDGPTGLNDLKECRPKIVPAALEYLRRWHKAFELFGDGQRFLQIDLKKPDGKEDNVVSKLDLTLATGNNSTLFDNGGGSGRIFSPASLALMLLVFQCFSPGGTIGVAQWNNKQTAGKSCSAPCIVDSMLHVFIRRDNLLDTIHQNLLTKDQVRDPALDVDIWGRPIWELMPRGPSDKSAIQNATQTYVGRLVPLSRGILLSDDCRTLILANGLTYEPWREPTATVVVKIKDNQETRDNLPVEIEKAVWRELHTLIVTAVDKNSNGGPLALRNIFDAAAFDLWAGGLAAKRAKLIDLSESVLHVPENMRHEAGKLLYERGVQLAERAAGRLVEAIKIYHQELRKDFDSSGARSLWKQIQRKASIQFWTDIELSVPQLLDAVAHPEKLGLSTDWCKTDWGKSVWTSSCKAYECVCFHDTPRQMRAYILGLNSLYSKQAEQEEAEL